MIESTEAIIQADAFEPTLHEVIDQLILVHDRFDSHDDHFAAHIRRFDVMEKGMRDMQSTLAVQGELLTRLTSGMQASECS